MKKILVVATPRDNRGRVEELLNVAHSVAEGTDAQISVLGTGSGFDVEAAKVGTDSVYQLKAPLTEGFYADELLDVVAKVSTEIRPTLILATADVLGLEVSPRLAVRLKAAYVSNCCAIERGASGRVDFARPIYGGKAVEIVESLAEVAVVTVKSKSFMNVVRRGMVGQVQVMDISASGRSNNVTRVGMEATGKVAGPSLEDASIIVSGGRGLGNADGFALLQQLAKRLDGTVGASRAAVDSGWISPALQVGQTGTTVAPDVYLAIGISGAVQHVAGMASSKNIVAINTDEEAPIFSVANVAVVADYREFLPALMEALDGNAA